MIGRILRALQPAAPADTPGGLGWNELYPTRPGSGAIVPSYRPTVVVAASTSSQLLAAANPSRRTISVFNDSTAELHLSLGRVASEGTAAATIAAGGLWTSAEPGVYRGDVAGVWASANGTAQVTETT